MPGGPKYEAISQEPELSIRRYLKCLYIFPGDYLNKDQASFCEASGSMQHLKIVQLKKLETGVCFMKILNILHQHHNKHRITKQTENEIIHLFSDENRRLQQQKKIFQNQI